MAHAQGWAGDVDWWVWACLMPGRVFEGDGNWHARSWMRATALPSFSVLHTDTCTFLPPLFETSESQNCVPWIYASGPAKG